MLPMKDLVVILKECGCDKIKTYIQSGNAVFDWHGKQKQSLASKLQSKISEQHGFSPEVLILTRSELASAIENNPFDTADGKALHFFFLISPPKSPDLEGLAGLKSETEQFKLHDKVFYLYAPDGIGRSKLAANACKYIQASATARNWSTVSKLMTMVAG